MNKFIYHVINCMLQLYNDSLYSFPRAFSCQNVHIRMVVAVGNFVFHNLFISLEELHCDNWPIFVCTIAVGINMNLN